MSRTTMTPTEIAKAYGPPARPEQVREVGARLRTILEELKHSGGDINHNVQQAISDFAKPADSYPDYDPNRWCMLREPAEFVRRLATALGLVGWLTRGTMFGRSGQIEERRAKQLQDLADWFDPPSTAPASGDDPFVPGDTLAHDHGIKRNRLAEAASAGHVRTKRAPPGQRTAQGRQVRKLFSRKDAVAHFC